MKQTDNMVSHLAGYSYVLHVPSVAFVIYFFINVCTTRCNQSAEGTEGYTVSSLNQIWFQCCNIESTVHSPVTVYYTPLTKVCYWVFFSGGGGGI